jgi:hypothetical protein
MAIRFFSTVLERRSAPRRFGIPADCSDTKKLFFLPINPDKLTPNQNICHATRMDHHGW